MARTAKPITLCDPKTGEVLAPRTSLSVVDGAQEALDDKADLVGGKIPAEQMPAMSYDPTGTASAAVAAHNTSGTAHQDIRTALAGKAETADVTAKLAGKADLQGGKVPAAQIPALGYDAAGAAEAVRTALTAHTGTVSGNPHHVTAAEVGARPNNWMPSASDVGAAPASHTHPASQITGACQLQTGSYTGTGTYGQENPCKVTFGFVPRFIAIGTDHDHDGIFIWISDAGEIGHVENNNASGGFFGSGLRFTLSGTTLQWYTVGDHYPDTEQGNIKDAVYRWVAFR